LRVWDIPAGRMCRNYLLGEHRELHAIWSILTEGKKGYSKHPDVLRWRRKLKALYLRHGALVDEMEGRGFKHGSTFDVRLASGCGVQDEFVDSVEEQARILRRKGCGCRI
jgi:hypothetical protein